MIEVLFARLNQLTNKLRKIAKYVGGSTYGDGSLGNWYVGFTDPAIPEENDFTQLKLSDDGINWMPIMPSYSFNNLTVEENAILTFQGDIACIRVKDTLTLKGKITINQHSGETYSTCGNAGNISTIQQMGRVEILPDNGKFITGGTYSENNVTNATGGVLMVYYNDLRNQYNVELDKNFGTAVNINGGANSNTPGGCLCIMAKKIILHPTGRLDVHGGDGSIANTGAFLNYKLREAEL